MHLKRLAIAVLVAAMSTSPEVVRSAVSFPSTNELVDAGGFKVHARLAGSGGVTTVFEAGLGEGSSTWNDVQAVVSQRALTIAYDRAGLGGSERSASSRDAREMAVELHTILRNLHAPEPFLLVGHSLGGYVLRVFAAMYSGEVAGLVFVDPIDEQLEASLQAKMPPAQWAARAAAITKAVGTLSLAAQREQNALTISGRQASQAWPLPDVPIMLLTGTKKNPEFPGNPLEQDTKLRLHDAFMDRLGRGTHVLVPTSRHYIQNDEPNAVIKAIDDVLNATRHKR
ncbi:MAG: hypothetical protein DLM53_00375 [Candidatus Eremiobacter antarcticus]|nr:MAG: hypothetical protein DLM53_00375 [Candidatus Eremiobacter sp. RRmetagenome_bin22]